MICCMHIARHVLHLCIGIELMCSHALFATCTLQSTRALKAGTVLQLLSGTCLLKISSEPLIGAPDPIVRTVAGADAKDGGAG